MNMESLEGRRATGTDWTVTLGLTVVALGTRAFDLGEGSFQVDEYYTVYHAAERSRTLMNPAYNVLALLSFKLFGISEWSARLPAMLLGAAGIPVFFATWRQVLGRYPALVGSLIALLSSWHLWHSQFCRYYAGVFLFGSIAYFLLFQSVRKDSTRHLMGGGIALILAILFHATAVMIVVSFATFCVVVLLLHWRGSGEQSRRVPLIFLVLCVLALAAATPFLWKVALRWDTVGSHWGYGPASLVLQLVKYVQIPVALAAFLGLFPLFRHDRLKGMFFLLGAGIPAAALVLGSGLTAVRPDFLFYSLPLVYGAAGFACGQAAETGSGRRLTAFTLTLIVLASMAPEMVSHYTARRSLHIQDVVRYIDKQYEDGDTVLSFVAGFDHYAEGRFPMERRPGSAFDNGVDWSEEMAPHGNAEDRLWIVLPARRDPPASRLGSWLAEHARLKWRRFEKRYDYTHKGYEVFMVPASREGGSGE